MGVISLDIHIDDLESVLALFNKIQVWRSATELGTYSEITSLLDEAAFIDGTVDGTWNLSGKTLTLVLNSADPINILFTGSDPFNLAAVLNIINALVPGLASEVPTDTNRIRLTSPVIGTGSAITASGSAATALGLPTAKANGKQARISLTTPTTEYVFKDFDGDETFWYKTRYFSTSTASVSAFSDPRQGNPQVVLPSNTLVKGTANLVDASGRPVVGRRLIFVPLTPMIVPTTSFAVLPGFDRLIAVTDESGNAEINLVIGARVRVFFEGSNFNREFVVPAEDFDILQIATSKPDPLSIVVSPPMPLRVS